ncbi:hypothetical protein LCGC14_2024630 [marine sediment metagenome]|uniref:Uncharacterized protein n=1 Tax=marine sediment metagenome TaxID=412755 RepID=A0A0F9HTK0_9ZZZZ
MKLNLDWDDTSKIRHLPELRKEPGIGTINVMVSPSSKGYHVRCKLKDKLSRIDIFRLRYKYHDDRRRLLRDLLLRPFTPDILHEAKVINGIKCIER